MEPSRKAENSITPINQNPRNLQISELEQLPREMMEIIFLYATSRNFKNLTLTCKRFKQIIATSPSLYTHWIQGVRSIISQRVAKNKVNVEPSTSFRQEISRTEAALKYFSEEKELNENMSLLEIKNEQRRLGRAKAIYDRALCEQTCACKAARIGLGILCCPLIFPIIPVVSLYNWFKYDSCACFSNPEEMQDDPNPLG